MRQQLKADFTLQRGGQTGVNEETKPLHSDAHKHNPNTNGLLDLYKHFRGATEAGSDPQGSTHTAISLLMFPSLTAPCVRLPFNRTASILISHLGQR